MHIENGRFVSKSQTTIVSKRPRTPRSSQLWIKIPEQGSNLQISSALRAAIETSYVTYEIRTQKKATYVYLLPRTHAGTQNKRLRKINDYNLSFCFTELVNGLREAGMKGRVEVEKAGGLFRFRYQPKMLSLYERRCNNLVKAREALRLKRENQAG